MKKHQRLGYFVHTLSIAVGMVLVWRGLWYLLDAIDIAFFAGQSVWTSLGGAILGFILLYAPDFDLKEIERL